MKYLIRFGFWIGLAIIILAVYIFKDNFFIVIVFGLFGGALVLLSTTYKK